MHAQEYEYKLGLSAENYKHCVRDVCGLGTLSLFTGKKGHLRYSSVSDNINHLDDLASQSKHLERKKREWCSQAL